MEGIKNEPTLALMFHFSLSMKKISKEIQNEIASIGKPEKARWLENYVKHDIKSKGTGIPEIRSIIKEATKKYDLAQKELSDQIELLDDLMSQEYSEDKLSAILYIQLFWKNQNAKTILSLTSNWLDKEWITDWNVCDWLCVRLLSPLLDREPELSISEFTIWNKSPNLWKARASLVPFAQCKTISKHSSTIIKFSTVLIKREERFCKTAVGWVLRQYSRIDDQLVKDFLEQNKAWMTKEVIKNATKYL